MCSAGHPTFRPSGTSITTSSPELIGGEPVSQPEDVQQSRRSRFFAWIEEQFRKERKEQFDREVQLTMVWMGHALIVFGVGLILAFLFGNESVGSAIHFFWAIEVAIIVLSFVTANTSSKPIVNALKDLFTGVDKFEKWMERHGDTARRRIQEATLLSVYTLQLASMTALLVATGGPIDSPFAPMALAIAVFSPFIVNKWWTVGLIIISTMVFYSVFVGIAGFDKEPTRPERGAYIAVNLFILLLASLMTWKRRERMVFTLRRTIDAPRDKVWEAWTERDEVVRWFGSDASNGSDVEMDVQPQGKWKASMVRQNGTPGFPWSGVYREVEPPKRLVFTITGRAGRGEEVVEVELEEKKGKTSMAVKLKDDGRHLGLKEGWSSFFDRMEQFLVDRDD
jgi:uncharacterized protein YndB with AHSA1/START domain